MSPETLCRIENQKSLQGAALPGGFYWNLPISFHRSSPGTLLTHSIIKMNAIQFVTRNLLCQGNCSLSSHKPKFLLKFCKDRHRYLQRLYQAGSRMA
jgi:hypothetical protein